jgi:transcriptional regulator with XRE-family HTH domain
MMGVPRSRRVSRRRVSKDLDLYIKDPGQMRQARLDKHVSQEELARAVGRGQSTISQIETGQLRRITYELANALSTWLHRPIHELFSLTVASNMTSAADCDSQREGAA